MAQVTVSIGGKSYRMACEDGQEDYLADLAARLDRSINQLRQRFGEIGYQRLTVMAALTFADRSLDAERRLRAAEAEISEGEDARVVAGERQAVDEANVTGALDQIADRIEALAARVAGGGSD